MSGVSKAAVQDLLKQLIEDLNTQEGRGHILGSVVSASDPIDECNWIAKVHTRGMANLTKLIAVVEGVRVELPTINWDAEGDHAQPEL